MEDLRTKRKFYRSNFNLFLKIKKKLTKKLLMKLGFVSLIILILLFPYEIGLFISWWISNFTKGINYIYV